MRNFTAEDDDDTVEAMNEDDILVYRYLGHMQCKRIKHAQMKQKLGEEYLTYLLTPWGRVLLEKLVKKFPAFYGTRRFITVLTSARHLSLS